MAEQHASNHGNTPAAWTTVALLVVAFATMCAGVIALSVPVFVVGVVLVVISLIVGKVMAMMGYGKQQPAASHEGADTADTAA